MAAPENDLRFAGAYKNQNYSTLAAETQSPADGLKSCLHRLQIVAGELWENSCRLGKIADNLSGTRAAKEATSPPTPAPDNTLFLARQIENGLSEVLSKQREEINRIENAIA